MTSYLISCQFSRGPDLISPAEIFDFPTYSAMHFNSQGTDLIAVTLTDSISIMETNLETTVDYREQYMEVNIYCCLMFCQLC